MVAKLESILGPIPWSLVLKAALTGIVWYFLPLWVFFLAAFYFYLTPLFEPKKFAVPFLIFLYLAASNSPSLWFAVFLAVIFYLMLGVKDLILINRSALYEVMVLLILFALFFNFFVTTSGWNDSGVFLAALIPSAAFFLLFGGLVDYLPPAFPPEKAGTETSQISQSESGESGKRKKLLVIGLSSFLVWQLALAIIFLPLNFVFASILWFVPVLLLTEIVPDYLRGTLSRQRIMSAFAAFFVVIVVILGATQWKL